MTTLLLGMCKFVRRPLARIEAFIMSPKRLGRLYGAIAIVFALLGMVACMQFVDGINSSSRTMIICLGISFGASLHAFFFLDKAGYQDQGLSINARPEFAPHWEPFDDGEMWIPGAVLWLWNASWDEARLALASPDEDEMGDWIYPSGEQVGQRGEAWPTHCCAPRAPIPPHGSIDSLASVYRKTARRTDA